MLRERNNTGLSWVKVRNARKKEKTKQRTGKERRRKRTKNEKA